MSILVSNLAGKRNCSTTTCLCSDCYYGTKYQFSTKGFLLSLNSILAHHTKPNILLTQQPAIIHISIV
ncbi:hypothetical protein I4U23_001410 [Adineta vaga]|nr:hypothetical protein I4U23_001410 [Adineta vaga]